MDQKMSVNVANVNLKITQIKFLTKIKMNMWLRQVEIWENRQIRQGIFNLEKTSVVCETLITSDFVSHGLMLNLSQNNQSIQHCYVQSSW